MLALEAGYRIRVVVRNKEGFERIKLLGLVARYIDRFEYFLMPDITIVGAFDKAVRGVEFIIYVASPLALPYLTDFENDLVKPAILGTTRILKSAHKTTSIKKIVITSSYIAIRSTRDILYRIGSNELFNGNFASTYLLDNILTYPKKKVGLLTIRDYIAIYWRRI